MAELCRECFIKIWHPNAYDIEHIVMSEDNDFCEGCMDCGPYVDHIDCRDMRQIYTAEDYRRISIQAIKDNKKVACIKCGNVFEDDDLAFGSETGLCPYCHYFIEAIWIKELIE